MTTAGKRWGAVVEAEEGHVMCIFLHDEFWCGGIIPQSESHAYLQIMPETRGIFLILGGYFGH
jgi:hypothetical protein